MKKVKITARQLILSKARVKLHGVMPVALTGTATLDDGRTIQIDTDALAVGSIVMIEGDNGPEPLPTGDYVLEDGTNFKVKDGVVAEITEGGSPDAGGEGLTNEQMGALLEAAASVVEEIVLERETALRQELQDILTTMGAKGVNLMAEVEEDEDEEETPPASSHNPKLKVVAPAGFKILSAIELKKLKGKDRSKYEREKVAFLSAQNNK